MCLCQRSQKQKKKKLWMRGMALSADSVGPRDSPLGSPQRRGVTLRPRAEHWE